MTFHSVNNSTCNPAFVDDDTTSSRQEGGVNGDAAGRSEDPSSAAWSLRPTINSAHLSTVSILRSHHHRHHDRHHHRHYVSPPQPEIPCCLFPPHQETMSEGGELLLRRIDSTVAAIDSVLRILLEDDDDDDDDEIFGSLKQYSHHNGHSMSDDADGSLQRQ